VALTPGTRLGPYEVVAPIGAGGMGEVYRARDTKLKRGVALKILPEIFGSDPECLARFKREAPALATALLLAMTPNTAAFAQADPCARVSDSGRAYSEPAVFAQRKAEWLACLDASPRDVDVLEQAADFIAVLDPTLALQLYENGRAIEPNNPRWTSKLAHLHSLNSQRSNDPLPEATLALAEAEKASAMGDSDPALAHMAFDAGDMNKARRYAQQLVNAAPTRQGSWDVGNMIHQGNLVLGRIAVREGRLADAVTFLGRSAEVPGSPTLNSFGPNMSLARDLLAAGETMAVLAYFERCRAFWRMGGSRLDQWAAEVRAGQIPNFGANLRY
jgi:hypothetical protein